MTDSQANDAGILIDYVWGQCSAEIAEQIRERLTDDAEFRQLHENIANCFAAVALSPEQDPPGGLAERTAAAVRQKQRVETLITHAEAARPSPRPAFSFRELTAVAAVLLVLAAVFIPSVKRARQAAMIDECSSNVGRIGSALLTYANENDDYLPGVDGEPYRWLPLEGQQAASNSAALFKLIKGQYVSPVAFQCPAVDGGSFVVQAGFVDFPAGQYINYSYQHTMGPEGLSRRDLYDVADDMAILADSTPMFEGGKFHPDRLGAPASKNHSRRGQNVLYVTGSVRWADDPTVGVRGDNIFLASGVYEYDGDEHPTELTDTFLLPNYTAGR